VDNECAPHHSIFSLVLSTFGVLFRADLAETNTAYTYSCIHAYRPIHIQEMRPVMRSGREGIAQLGTNRRILEISRTVLFKVPLGCHHFL